MGVKNQVLLSRTNDNKDDVLLSLLVIAPRIAVEQKETCPTGRHGCRAVNFPHNMEAVVRYLCAMFVE